jgi:hypothetical protein
MGNNQTVFTEEEVENYLVRNMIQIILSSIIFHIEQTFSNYKIEIYENVLFSMGKR